MYGAHLVAHRRAHKGHAVMIPEGLPCLLTNNAGNGVRRGMVSKVGILKPCLWTASALSIHLSVK